MAKSRRKRTPKPPDQRSYHETIMVTWEHKKAVEQKMEEEGLTKTQVYRRALDAYFFNKRRASDHQHCDGESPKRTKKRK